MRLDPTKRAATLSAIAIATVGIVTAAGLQACADRKDGPGQIHVERAVACYTSGNLAGAIAELRKALALDSSDPDLYFMLGNALYRSRDMRGAADSYTVLLVQRPGHFEAHMSRGFALYELGEFRQAMADWLAAVRLEPRGPFAHAALAVGLYTTRQTEDAKTQYAIAEALDPRYSDPQNLYLDIRWRAKSLGVVKHLLQLLQSEKDRDFNE